MQPPRPFSTAMSVCLLLLFVLQPCLHGQVALGAPVTHNNTILARRDVYPFPNDIVAAFMNKGGPPVFMTQYEDYTDAADQFIRDVQGLTFHDAYFPGFLAKRGDSDRDYQTFIDAAAKYYAERAEGTAYILTNREYVVDACRTFNRISFPALFYPPGHKTYHPKIKSLHLVDYTNATNRRKLFAKGSIKPISLPGGVVPKGIHNPRGSKEDIPRCYDWNGYGEDPTLPNFHPKSWRSYMPGQCGVHVVQYQRNDKHINPSPNYRLNITVVDARGQGIGHVRWADAPNAVAVDVPTKLRKRFSARALADDHDPILFSYGKKLRWDTDDAACRVGKYDVGRREIDCGFPCK